MQTSKLATYKHTEKNENHQIKKTSFYSNSHKHLKTYSYADFDEDKFISANEAYKVHKKSDKKDLFKYQQQASTGTTSSPAATNPDNLPASQYQIDGIAGKGTFGVVYFGKEKLSGKKIALKKVLQDKKYKNRELEILKEVEH